MKKSYLLFLLLPVIIIITLLNKKRNRGSDYFSGQVVYQYSYTSDSLNDDSLSQIKPSKSIFRFDILNYQSQFFEKDTFTYYYSSLLNKAATKTNSQMADSCEDYSLPTDSIHSFKIYNTDEKVLGYACRILEFESDIFHTRYWVSSDLRITPATYKNHKAYNWSFYGEHTNGGLILKLEHQFKSYTMKGIATAVSPGDKNFKALEMNEELIKQICKK